MDRLFPEFFPQIFEHLPVIVRPSTCLSLALTSWRFYYILIPSVLYRYVKFEREEIAFENLKHLTNDIEQSTDHPVAHYIHNLFIQSIVRLPTSDFNGLSFSWLKQLVESDGLRNLKALNIKLCAAQTSPDGSLEEFDFSDLWSSINAHCPALREVDFTGFPQLYVRKDWVFGQIISSKTLRSLHLDIILFPEYISEASFELPPFCRDLINLKFSTGGRDSLSVQALRNTLSGVYPNLHTLTLLHVPFVSVEPKPFWKVHPKIERLELDNTVGNWFEDFEEGMLPDLKYLKAGMMARVDLLLPHVYQQMISLTIPLSYNAQALYLLRSTTGGKPFPRLRYLAIHLVSRNSFTEEYEGSDWRESDDRQLSQGRDKSEVSSPTPERFFDSSYITSIARAAPYLTTLELMGHSRGCFSDLTESLSQLSCLRHIIFSGPQHFAFPPFFTFYKTWEEYRPMNPSCWTGEMDSVEAPASFNEAVEKLAEKCRSLEKVTIGFVFGDLLIEPGMLSARVIRDLKGDIADIIRIKARGETLGREDNWY